MLAKCLAVVFASEGGYSDHPNDRGGKTMMGITEGTLNSAYKSGIVGHNDVKKLTRAEAEKIYDKRFWGPSKSNIMPWPLNLLNFDMAVNHGIGGGGKILQRAINVILVDSPIKVDGSIGNETLAALKACTSNDEHMALFCTILLDMREKRFGEIVHSNPSQKAFLKGWLNRVSKLRKIVDSAIKNGELGKWQ